MSGSDKSNAREMQLIIDAIKLENAPLFDRRATLTMRGDMWKMLLNVLEAMPSSNGPFVLRDAAQRMADAVGAHDNQNMPWSVVRSARENLLSALKGLPCVSSATLSSNDTLRFVAKAIREHAESLKLGATFDGGPLHGASCHNVLTYCARSVESYINDRPASTDIVGGSQ